MGSMQKDKELTEMIKGALPVGILGIGEPLIYGVTLPLGRPFITACIGGGIGGAVVGLVGNIGAIAIGPSGVALIPLIANGRWWGYVLGLLAAYAGGFLATYFFGIPKEQLEKHLSRNNRGYYCQTYNSSKRSEFNFYCKWCSSYIRRSK